MLFILVISRAMIPEGKFLKTKSPTLLWSFLRTGRDSNTVPTMLWGWQGGNFTYCKTNTSWTTLKTKSPTLLWSFLRTGRDSNAVPTMLWGWQGGNFPKLEYWMIYIQVITFQFPRKRSTTFLGWLINASIRSLVAFFRFFSRINASFFELNSST